VAAQRAEVRIAVSRRDLALHAAFVAGVVLGLLMIAFL
jgi:hypothetical protein